MFAGIIEQLGSIDRIETAGTNKHFFVKSSITDELYIDQSIALNDYWYTNWMKAEILAQSGDKKAAKKQAEHALEMGDAHYAERNQPFTYKEGLMKEMMEW